MCSSTLNRSAEIARSTFGVMKRDPEMILFPCLAALASVGFSALLLVPTIFLERMTGTHSGAEGSAFGILEYAVLFVTYLGLAFIGTFSNVCVVFIAKTRFEGGDASFSDALRFALTRVMQILAWSALAASVGVILARLDGLADRLRGIPGMVLRALRDAVGFAWSVVTLFVVPVMVYENVGPVDALSRSASTLKKTWGESLARHFGFGFIGFLLGLPGIGMLAFAFFAFTLNLWFGIAMLVLGVLYLLLVAMVMSVANAVFNTALYHFAASGQVAHGFNSITLQRAFRG